MAEAPVIWWVRRDLRLSDNPALRAAVDTGRPVIPLFICDEVVETHKPAPAWRLGAGVATFAAALRKAGSALTLRRGRALDILRAVIAETGADAVVWGRLHDPAAIARDTGVEAGLEADGVAARSTDGHTLVEPWSLRTGQGGFYKVYTPYWRAVWARGVAPPLPPPGRLPAPETWPGSESLDHWGLGRAMGRGADIVERHLCLGEAAARDRLDGFIAAKIETYAERRDFPGVDGTSGLGEPLTYGEIGPRTCYHAALDLAMAGEGGAQTFLKELVWRDFAYHLVHHTPHIVHGNWRAEWDAFPWQTDEGHPHVTAWKRGRTGIEIVDAAMREMYVTGRMHNRARMLVASYLTKHLLFHWKIGLAWFEECLVDWDPASNALGWQWSAGSGPDATPYFRVFNPETQAAKFDGDGRYRRRWLAEIATRPTDTARSFFDAIPRHWAMSAQDAYPASPIVSASEGRKRALAAYENRNFRPFGRNAPL